jgi:DNA-binding MarR family transcriptional regulator
VAPSVAGRLPAAGGAINAGAPPHRQYPDAGVNIRTNTPDFVRVMTKFPGDTSCMPSDSPTDIERLPAGRRVPLPLAARRRPSAAEFFRRRQFEAELLIEEIRLTAAALDMARSVLARRHNIWGFAAGTRERHALLVALASRSDGEFTVGRLAAQLRCSRQAIHRLARALEQRGLVTVAVHFATQRVACVTIAPSGRAQQASAARSAGLCAAEVTESMEGRAMREVATAMRRIRQCTADLRTGRIPPP